MSRKPLPVQHELIGIPPVRPTVKATPRVSLVKVDSIALVVAFILMLAMVAVAASIPGKDRPHWRVPGLELPASEARITGVYVRAGEAGPLIVKEPLVYVVSIGEDATGKEIKCEYWLLDNETRHNMAPRREPIYWAPRAEGEALSLPEIPDLYLEARARK